MEIVNLILHYTNLKINALLDILHQERKPYYARTNDATELLAFWGFFYAQGLLHHNLMDTENLFNEKVGQRIYSSIMSLNRFKFIKRMITFDDPTTRNDRWKINFQHLERCSKCSTSNTHGTIHQTTFST